jgi:large subunit ribosomal protein L6e
MVVVVLEGVFASKRVVFLKSLENHLALCAGPRSINGVPLFKIDERYLFATSTVLSTDVDISVDESSVLITERDVYAMPADAEMSEEEEKIDSALAQAAGKENFLKAYLSASFEISKDVDFYSLRY